MPPFDTLGPYKIGSMLGRGGMGSVYEGTHLKTGECVAVKLIATQYADDMRFRRRFVSEIETLMRLRHENLVRILGCGEEADHLFYAMELVDGETLRQRIRRVKRLEWKSVLDVAIQIATALKHAHDIGVQHRDLKPANIILLPNLEGEDTPADHVKVVDFGIVKMFPIEWKAAEDLEQQFDPEGRLDSASLTAAGSILGTADYMAPEQAGDGPITARTDLYALGSLIYTMLVGRPPFTGKNATEVIDSLKRERPIPLQMINPDLPDDLTQLVDELLEKDPDARPRTALAVKKRLQAMRVGLQHQATRGGLDEETRSTRAETGRAGAGDPADSTASRANPKDKTVNVAGQPTDGAPEQMDFDIEAPLVKPKSHYQPIDKEKLESQLLSRVDDPGQKWIQTASIAGMVAILLGGVYLTFDAFKTPSADALYARIVSAEEEDELFRVEKSMDLFLDTYPSDERTGRVEGLSATLQGDRFLRRLRFRAGQSGGIESLPPDEMAFYEAMSERKTDPILARERMNAWLDVFGSGPEGEAENRGVMVTTLQSEIDRIDAILGAPRSDQRLAQLLGRIDWASEHLAAAPLARACRGIVTLYGKKNWASPAVDRAKRLLATLDANADRDARDHAAESDSATSSVPEDRQ